MNETSSSEPLQDDAAAGGYQPQAAGRPPLRRAYHGRILGGVAAGISSYLGVDTIVIRIAFVVFTAMGGAGVPVYLACLLLMPEEGSDVSLATSLLDSVRLSPGGRPPVPPMHARSDDQRIGHAVALTRSPKEQNRNVTIVRPGVDAPHPYRLLRRNPRLGRRARRGR